MDFRPPTASRSVIGGTWYVGAWYDASAAPES